MSEAEIKKPKKKRFKRLLLWFSLSTIVLALLITLLITLLAYNHSFRSAAIAKILALVSTQLRADLEIQDIHLIGFTGFKLDGVRLTVDGVPLAEVDEIIGDISFEPLLRNKIHLNKLILNSPRIMLLRSNEDSLWNFNKIVYPQEPSIEEVHQEIDLTIRLRDFQIRNGLFFMLDSLADKMPENMFDPTHIKFQNINLKMASNANLGKMSFKTNIKELNLECLNSNIVINKFTGKAAIDRQGIQLENAKIFADDLEAVIDISISNFNAIEDAENLDNSIFKIDFEGKNITPDLITKFAVIPIELGSKFDVEFYSLGTLNELDVKDLSVNFSNSNIQGSGKLYGLLNNSPSYEFNFQNSNIVNDDIAELLPSEDLSSVPNFGNIILKDVFVSGDVHKVFSQLDIQSRIGNVSGRASIEFQGMLKFDANLSFNRVNLEFLLNDSEFRSNLNGRLLANGSGDNLDNLLLNMNLTSNNSSFSRFYYEALSIKASIIENNILILDSLQITLKDYDLIENAKTGIFASAKIDYSDFDHIKYGITANVRGLNLKELLLNNALPSHFSGDFNIIGEGTDLDNITSQIEFNLYEMLFKDKAMMPFDISADIKLTPDTLSHILFYSDFIDLELKGKFIMTELLDMLANQSYYLQDFANARITELFPNIPKDTSETIMSIKKAEFPSLNCELIANVKDISPTLLFLDDMTIDAQFELRLGVNTIPTESFFSLDNFKIQRFSLQMPDLSLSARDIHSNATMNIMLLDSLPKFSYLNLFTEVNNNIFINESQITRPNLELNFDGNVVTFATNSGFDNILNGKAIGSMDISGYEVILAIDTLSIDYIEIFNWQNYEPIVIAVRDERIDVRSLKISREGAEKLTVSGVVDNNIADRVYIKLSDFQLQDIIQLSQEPLIDELQTLRGKISDFEIGVFGDLMMPEISFNCNIDGILFNNYNIGELSANLRSINGIFVGSASLLSPQRRDNKELLSINIRSLPIYLGIDTNRTMFSATQRTDIIAETYSFPLVLVSPFVPNISNLQGSVNSKLFISGFLPDKYTYQGSANIFNTSFLLDNTNIYYSAQGDVSIEKDKIIIDKATLRNRNSDLRGGQAIVTGFVNLKDFFPEYIDISVSAEKFLVLSDASSKSMPGLYGNFIIGTEQRPLRFFGTMTEPNLEGDVIVWNADLKMPQIINQQIIRTTFNYEVKGTTKVYKFTSEVDSILLEQATAQIEEDFAELINFDLNIKIKNFTVLIDLGSLGEVFAKIGTRDPSIPMRYVKYRNVPTPKLYSGELELKEGSVVKVFRNMETKGSISFPTGALDNPLLELEARHDGNYVEGNTTNYYSVFLYITGTKDRPNLRLDYTINGEPAVGDPKKIEEDAFILLATGKARGAGGGVLNTANLVGEGLNMGISQLASKSLTDLLLGTGVVQSADVRFAGEGFETAQVNLSGSVAGIGNWTIGGNIADLSSNYEVTLEVPISVQSRFLNNFILQFSKATNMNVQSQIRDAKDFEVKIKFGGSW